MQKKLLTMAVAGALAVPGLALAQSSVEVYGTINMSFGNVKYDAVPVAGGGSISKWDVANHASNYGLRGRESLGTGLTAWFQIEQNAPLERSNNVAITPASRNSAVGLQGGWGNVFIGQWTTPWADLDGLWSVGTVGGWGPVTSIIGRRETTGSAPNLNCVNGHWSGGASPAAPTPSAAALAAGAAPAGTALLACDPVESGGGVGHPFWRRPSQSIFYQSPVFGGVQAKFMYQTNEGKSNAGVVTGGVTSVASDPSMWSASLQWAGMGGRLRVGAAYDSHKEFSAVGENDTGWKLAGGWNFGFADVGLVYESVEYALPTAAVFPNPFAYSGSKCEGEQFGIAIAIPIGSGAIRGSYAQAEAFDGPAGCRPASGAGNGGEAITWNVGYDHRFSKRTTVGFGYATIENEASARYSWTGLPPNQSGVDVAGPLAAGTVKTFFVNMIHRF